MLSFKIINQAKSHTLDLYKGQYVKTLLVRLYRRGEHFGVQQVSADVLDWSDLQEACSSEDVGHAAVADGQRGRVGKVQQGSQRLRRHKVDMVEVLLVGGGPRREELVEVGAEGGQDGAVGRELAVLGHQEHVAQRAAEPLAVQAAQDVGAVLGEGDPHGALLRLPGPSPPPAATAASRPSQPPPAPPTGS